MMKKRWNEIDVLYALGIILVVLGHSHSNDWSSFSGTILESIITFIYIFHMPLFFFIAGFLFLNSKSLLKIGYGKWMGNKAKRLLTPYIILSVIALVPKYYFENNGITGLMQYLIKAILIPRYGVWGHFWFLPVLLLLYLVFGIWRIFVTNENLKNGIIGALIVSIVLYFFPFSTDWIGFGDFKEAAIYFVMGMIWYLILIHTKIRYFKIISIIWCISGIVITLFFTQRFCENRLSMLLSAIIMISVCWQIAGIIGENYICQWLSDNNFTIYIYAWPFQAIVMAICNSFGLTWYFTTFCMFISGIISPALLIAAYKKLRVIHNEFFNLLIGIK